MKTDEKVARRKLSLLELAQDLGNASSLQGNGLLPAPLRP
tara:strand:- start:1292 stop:1411 length:120 start_codon:yes stop_codon:yes gene_type:complete